MGFKKDFDIHVRKGESQKIMRKYPGKVPVIVERQEHSEMPNIDKKKYLVPGDLNMSHFIYVVRKRIKLEPSETLFFGQTLHRNFVIVFKAKLERIRATSFSDSRQDTIVSGPK